jgi:type IV pilus assembly protein PilB
METGKVSEELLAQTMAMNSGMEYVDLSGFVPDAATLELMPSETAVKYHVIPVGVEDGRLSVAVADPLDFQAMDSLPHLVSFPLDFYCAPRSQITQFLTEFFGYRKEAGGDLSFAGSDATAPATESDAPIIKLVADLLAEAVNSRASDIHVEPLEKRLYNTFLTTAGVSIFVPRMKPRLFNF